MAQTEQQLLAIILDGFEKGVFVRSILNDDQSDWAIRCVPYLRALALAQEVVARGASLDAVKVG